MPVKSKKAYQVLIVDDIPNNLNFVSDALFQEGIGITIATNGPDALEIATLKYPDLILLDISMPEMDGYEVCRHLKNNEKTSEIPVIFLTAKVESEDIIKGFQVGAVDYIVKPFNAMELISRVKTHLELKDKREQLEQLNKSLEEKVTERTQELKQKNDELKIAYQKLENLDKAKNEFILHINHELRTPLQGIHGYSKLIEEYAQNNEQLEFVHGLNRLTDRLVRLSEISLLFTELKAANYKEEIHPVSVKEVFDKLILKHIDNEKNILIKKEMHPETIEISADIKLMMTCMEILVDNALKYSSNNSMILLKAGTYNHTHVLIEIIDHGPGFSDKSKQAVFDLFTADNTDHKSYGFGIGLATAKLIMEHVSGKIEIENNEELGATVKLYFPLLAVN
ncbi:MAG: response regulator [Bacteroidetes bacterium]|jgi:DNA-binding response OmpR family regulator/anti-sigma regulatory factor (Ser/Thr protein kinase)|nr:response regulator [Bacteroidota bacterium]